MNGAVSKNLGLLAAFDGPLLFLANGFELFLLLLKRHRAGAAEELLLADRLRGSCAATLASSTQRENYLPLL